jgi:protein-tyrosine-phosphatase
VPFYTIKTKRQNETENKMKKTDEQMLKLIEEQKANAERLAEEISELSGDDTDTVLILDALACAGLRIVPMEAGENVASLAMFSILQQQASEV